MESITVIGRTWFRKSAGNSYCTCDVLVDGRLIARLPKESGYGDYYLQKAFEYLDNVQLIALHRYPNGSTETPWQYCRRNNIHLYNTITPVAKESDL